MNPQEAIKRIDDVLGSDYYYDESLGYQLTSDDFEWLEKAKEALEKQIPKKPEYYGDGYANGEMVYDYAKCPQCDNDNFEYDINNWGCKYCPDCGQALDWSDTE